MLESQFSSNHVKKNLDALIKLGCPLYYFIKEAGSIRGIPDVVICCNGQFAAWELKKDEAETRKTTGRIVLQRYTLQRIELAKGRGRFVHPGNLWNEIVELLTECNQGQYLALLSKGKRTSSKGGA